jgi:hypothetical protein
MTKPVIQAEIPGPEIQRGDWHVQRDEANRSQQDLFEMRGINETKFQLYFLTIHLTQSLSSMHQWSLSAAACNYLHIKQIIGVAQRNDIVIRAAMLCGSAETPAADVAKHSSPRQG